MKFARQLRGMGVDEALRARGAKVGIWSASASLSLNSLTKEDCNG